MQRHTSTLMAVLAAAVMAFGCAYDYGETGQPDESGPGEPGEPGEPGGPEGLPDPTNLDEALALAQAADAAVRADTAEVLAKGAAMEAAGLLFEADLETAELTGSVAALQAAVNDGRVALMDAELANMAGERIGENLRIIAAVTTDTVGLLAADPGGAAKAQQILALARDAELNSGAAVAAFDTAIAGLEVLLAEFAEAAGVAEELGQEALAVQLEAEAEAATEIEVRIEETETRIIALDGAIEAGLLALEDALAGGV